MEDLEDNISRLDELLEENRYSAFFIATVLLFHEPYILESILNACIKSKNNNMLSQDIKKFFLHLIIDYDDLVNANLHTLAKLVDEYNNIFQE